MQKTFKLHWLTGEPETVHGYDIADAIIKAGYGGGDMGALDYWEEVKDQPQDTTLVPEYVPKQPFYKGNGEHSVNELEAICEAYKKYVSYLNSRP